MRDLIRGISAGLLLLGTVTALSACGDLFVGPDPADDPETNFEILWHTFDAFYAFFEHKDADWDSIYAVHRPRVGPATTASELRGIFAEMIDYLEDGHVTLYTPMGSYQYEDWYLPYPENFDLQVITSGYLSTVRSSGGGRITYGMLEGTEIGYLHIADFTGEGWAGAVDGVLADLGGARALVVDVRNNFGGSDSNSDPVAGRFADRRRLSERVAYRDGPDHDDFTELIERYVEPGGSRRFTGPIALLTNRRVYSTGESFVLAMRAMPYVTVIGDTTGGGSGNPILRELPNGWTYRLSRWISYTPEGRIWEGSGLYPDIAVGITPADETAGIDTILERAISELATPASYFTLP